MNAVKRQNQKLQKKPKGCRATALLSVANQCDNPLLKIDSSFYLFHKNDFNFNVSCHQWSQLDEECQQWMIQLTEDNMKPYYESSSCGWNRSNKLKELKDKTSRLLLLKCVDTNQSIAFVNFRFEVGGNDSECVIYCYELQVVDSHQRSGVGQYLMSVVYEMGHTFHMEKVMLTVFKRNTIAMNFYTKALNYRIDRSSPSRFNIVADYEILSLKINKHTNI